MVEIKITKWMGHLQESQEVLILRRDPNGDWLLDPTNEHVDLADTLHVPPDGALWIETQSGETPLREICLHLPRGQGYSGWAYDRALPETGIDAIDSLEDDGGMPVFVDGQRIGLLQVREGAESSESWIVCDARESADGRARPRFVRAIAWCSGIQVNSMTSGSSSWAVGELPDGRIAFTYDEDEESFSIDVASRDERSDSELVEELAARAWEPAGLGLRVAAEQGRVILDEYLDDLVDGDFSGVVVSAQVCKL